MDDLTERVAVALYYAEHPEERHRDGWTSEHPEERYLYRDLTAAVLPIIRKAQADALRDAAGSFGPSGNIHYPGARVRERLRARARRIEKEQTNG